MRTRARGLEWKGKVLGRDRSSRLTLNADLCPQRRKSMVPQPAAPASGPSLNFNLASTPLSSTQEESEESARSHTSSSPAPVARSSMFKILCHVASKADTVVGEDPLAPLERARQKTLAYARKFDACRSSVDLH